MKIMGGLHIEDFYCEVLKYPSNVGFYIPRFRGLRDWEYIRDADGRIAHWDTEDRAWLAMLHHALRGYP